MREESIDLMGDTLLDKLVDHSDNGDYENVHAIYQEWVIDGVDPIEDNYEFLFLEFISEVAEWQITSPNTLVLVLMGNK